MNRIRLLPEQVANQIAAGEVVERPASVVKELVENALDAQVSRITVEIQAGGRSLVRVTDDGVGMNRDDALLCLERHATSKIQKAEDLATITTMGFRGEALPSIASVSRFTLTTRERNGDTPEGTQVVVHGGKILQVKSAGHAPGTDVEVRQLFYNLPARRKFLRSEETERAHVQHYLTLAALAFPEVGFTFLQDQRPVWQLPPLRGDGPLASKQAALQERLRALLGAETKLLPVDYFTEIGEPDEPDDISRPSLPDTRPSTLRIWGFLGAPGVSRATREEQHLFVNRRPVENRALNFALLEGYHTALMKGRYPVCCLFLELDPADVDVNIHPSKREVKFRREKAVRRHAAEAVRRTLLNFHTAPGKAQIEVESSKLKVERAVATGIPPIQPGNSIEPAVAVPTAKDLAQLLPPPAGPITNRASPSPANTPDAASAAPPAIGQRQPTSDIPRSAVRVAHSPAPPVSSAVVPLLKVPLPLVGVLGRLYGVLASDRAL